MHDHDYVMDFYLMVMLRSTMGPYGRPVIEVAYGKMIISLHRGCMGDDSSRRVVRVSTWCIVHVWHTRVNTSVGSVYIIFLSFHDIKIYICILFSKSICSIKEHGWSLILFWPDEDQRMFSTVHKLLNTKLKSQTTLWWLYTKIIILIMILGCNYVLFN